MRELRAGISQQNQIRDSAVLAVRDELRRLNSLLHCANFVAMPSTLRQISRNTAKRKRPKGRPKLRVVAGGK